MINRVITYLVRKRKPAFFLTLALLIITGFLISFPSFDGKIIGFDLKGNNYYTTALKVNSLFGGQNRVYMKITPAKDNIQDVFAGVHALEQALKKEFPDATIISLRYFYNVMFNDPGSTNGSLNKFLTDASAYPVLNDLISNDKKSFLVVMTFDSLAKFDVASFDSIIDERYIGVAKIKAVSFYHIEKTIETYIRRDFVVLSLIIFVSFTLFFLYLFRKFSAVFFTACIVGISIFASIFFFSILHFHLNLVTILVIPVVLVLSLSDSIHLLTGYVSFGDIEDKGERIKKVVSHYIIPSFYSSATTSAAFFTFYLFNDSEFIREFGLITGFCLMTEFFLTFLIAPFLLEVVNVKKINDSKVSGIGNFLEKKQKWFSFAFILLFISSFFFLNKLNFKNSSESFFPRNSELYATHTEFNRDFYSQVKLDILVEGNKNDSASGSIEQQNPEELIDSLTNYFRNTKGIARVNSATDQHTIESVPGGLFNFLDLLGNRNPYYSKKNNIYRIELKVEDPKIIKDLAREILPLLVKNFPDNHISYSSPVLIMDYVNKKVSASLINSLLTSGVSIILMIFLLTRSIGITLASLLPNLVPLSFIVFIYIILRLEINILTAITAVVCLGLLDDDTIHILYRRLWLKEPLKELSFSILSASIILSAGFGMFWFSSFRPTQVFGVVSALVFLLGVICELTLMPWIINFWISKAANKNETGTNDK